jgi:hypothetical protein
MHFLHTGIIWDGGNPPDIHSLQYAPLLHELREGEQKAGTEEARGEPWTLRMPTTLVKLRDDDKLPAWKQVGGEWVPA